MNYLETSALIKRFVIEPGRERILHLTAATQDLATATITYVELYSGLTRRKNRRDISLRQYAAVGDSFEADWRSYRHVHLTWDILGLARDLIPRHSLRGADAIHLASALELRRVMGEPILFVASDRQLLTAAAAEGLETFNPEIAKAL